LNSQLNKLLKFTVHHSELSTVGNLDFTLTEHLPFSDQKLITFLIMLSSVNIVASIFTLI